MVAPESETHPWRSAQEAVPVRTIVVTIALVLATFLAIYLIKLLAHIEALLIVSAFFAVVLTPVVDVTRRQLRIKRGIAAGLVFLVVTSLIVAMLYAFIQPLVDQAATFTDDFPIFLEKTRAGEGTFGDLVKRYDLERRYDENEESIRNAIDNARDKAADIARQIFAGVLSLLTVVVLTVMMLLFGPDLLESGLGTLAPRRQARVRAVAADCAKALTGYVMGNLLISLIAGSITFVALWIAGVPFRGVLALWVGFADLIPLVGATLGAIPTIGVAFLHSIPAGIAMTIVYIVYQQFENHVLQPAIMSRTVKINQLFVLVSVLIGVELFGILGALLAIPAAGVIQVIVRDMWDQRRGRFKEEPTIGVDEVPASQVDDADVADVDVADAAHVADAAVADQVDD